jgi:uncharacterized protein
MLVLSELDYRCAQRLAPAVWDGFLEDLIEGAYQTEAPTTTDLVRCRELQARYADLALGVVDASVIALAERLGEAKLATLDRRHFSLIRPSHTGALRLLP